jgi:hypothetical protein
MCWQPFPFVAAVHERLWPILTSTEGAALRRSLHTAPLLEHLRPPVPSTALYSQHNSNKLLPKKDTIEEKKMVTLEC